MNEEVSRPFQDKLIHLAWFYGASITITLKILQRAGYSANKLSVIEAWVKLDERYSHV